MSCIHERLFLCSSADVAVVLSEMAQIRVSERKYADAMGLLQRTVAISRASLGDTHPNVGLQLRDIGCVLLVQSKYQEACDEFSNAQLVLETALGPMHPDVATVYVGQAVSMCHMEGV
jgi:hypothetical protein